MDTNAGIMQEKTIKNLRNLSLGSTVTALLVFILYLSIPSNLASFDTGWLLSISLSMAVLTLVLNFELFRETKEENAKICGIIGAFILASPILYFTYSSCFEYTLHLIKNPEYDRLFVISIIIATYTSIILKMINRVRGSNLTKWGYRIGAIIVLSPLLISCYMGLQILLNK